MAEKKVSKTASVTPVEMAEFTESLTIGRPVALKKKAKKKVRRGAARSGRTDDPRQLSLPGLAEIWRAMPNHLARSALFTPVKKGRKRRLEGELLVSRGDAEIRYWGEQLDEAQADVWMQAMYEAGRSSDLGKIHINRAGFLRSIGRKTGKHEYDWLKKTMLRLMQSVVEVRLVRKDGAKKWATGKALGLVDGFDYDDQAGTYLLRVNPEWKTLYGANGYSLIDWTKRKQFGLQQDMAKSLQRLIATSKTANQHYELGWLKGRLASESELKEFRRSLRKAFVELERLEIVSGARIERSVSGREQASWTRLGVNGKPTQELS